MPLFATGQWDGPFAPFYGLRDPLTVPELEQIVQDARNTAREVFEFGEKKVEQIGALKILGFVKEVTFLAGEVAKELAKPRALNTIEASALAQQQEREQQEREAMAVMERPKPLKVEQSDP